MNDKPDTQAPLHPDSQPQPDKPRSVREALALAVSAEEQWAKEFNEEFGFKSVVVVGLTHGDRPIIIKSTDSPVHQVGMVQSVIHYLSGLVRGAVL